MIKISLPTNTLAALTDIQVQEAIIIPCDDRCMFAKEAECDCECGGKNHQQGERLTKVQMFQPRTDAGRKIKTIAPGTPEWDQAVKFLELRDVEGMSQKDIAAQFHVSAPVVRRAIRSLTWSLAVAEQQAKVAASTAKARAAKAAKKAAQQG